MATKLTFRARTLDATKAMAIYRAEDLPELADSNAINRSVPAMPSGMEKEEESEKHLQDILDAQSRNRDDPNYTPAPIPVPEVKEGCEDNLDDIYKSIYQAEYKPTRAYIHVQPFTADADQPTYDMDEEDERFLKDTIRNERKFECDDITFEGMLDRLEQNSGVNVVSAKEAKLLLKEDDELILAVYDYWVDKRLRLKQPLILTVKSDKREVSGGTGSSNSNTGGSGAGGSSGGGGGSSQGGSQGNQNQNSASTSPYIAFRRRTEKMQTRKNRKNDEVSYEKMLKLRRDLSQAIVLLEMVKRREKTKKEHLNLTADIFERRYVVGDWDGRLINEIRAARLSKVLQPHRPAFGEQNWFHNSGDMIQMGGDMSGSSVPRRERHKSNKKRKSSKNSRSLHHGSLPFSSIQPSFLGGQLSIGNSGMGSSALSSDDEYGMLPSQSSDLEDEEDGYFAFKRKRNCQYLRPKLDDYDSDDCGLDSFEETPHKFLRLDDLEVEKEMNQNMSNKLKYSLASLSVPKFRFIGFARRRMGRGGRVILDRASIKDSMAAFHAAQLLSNSDRWGEEFMSGNMNSGPNYGRLNSHERLQHFRPVTPPGCRDNWTTNSSSSQIGSSNDPFSNSWLPSHPVKTLMKDQLSPGMLSRQVQRHRSGGGTNVKTVSLDPVTAQNAATAVVTSDYLDIFGSY